LLVHRQVDGLPRPAEATISKPRRRLEPQLRRRLLVLQYRHDVLHELRAIVADLLADETGQSLRTASRVARLALLEAFARHAAPRCFAVVLNALRTLRHG